MQPSKEEVKINSCAKPPLPTPKRDHLAINLTNH